MQQMSACRAALFVAAIGFAQPVLAAEPLQQRVEAVLAQAGAGTRFGLVVATADGRELVAVAPTDRFIPASNTKMFPTAATFASVAGLDEPDTNGGAAVRLEKSGHGTPDVILTGHGDARLSSAEDCTVDCLAALADAVAAKTRHVHDVVGDDTLFPDQRWSPGMSWNNIPSAYGTAISALTLDDNEMTLRVTPGVAGMPPATELPLPYYTIENRAVTVAAGKTDLNADRLPGERTIRLTGTIAAGATPDVIRLGIDDPADYAAWRLKTLLEARGVKVSGAIATRHRPFMPSDDPKLRGATPPVRPPQPDALARLVPPPLIEDLTLTAKVSQNLHAELFLRRLGLIEGTGSIEDGEAVIKSMLARAGVPRAGFDFSDGSGMSTYNRLAPRAVVTFLRWIAAQPWGAAWRATLPVGGVDGTLRNRFKGTPLEGKLTAKTGSLNATNALSGYLTAKSGQTLTFSAFANDVPADAEATKAMDAALELIANEN
jgi:D-alanyl-D-alanine carboxypeptidase/D-alanyl-D-alanine-endopeptidase (penicillin-binding protein 4)